MRLNWSGGLIDWTENNTAFISVVFSWQRQKAYQKAIWYKTQGYDVRLGGPAIAISPSMFSEVGSVGGDIDALSRHNQNATFTSRGCVRKCSFCIVPKAEGELRELSQWPVRPIVCDNNLLATSQKHFDSVIDKLKSLKGIDFNQGLDARLLTKHHAERLRELKTKTIRLAWDSIGIENKFMRAWDLLRIAGIPKSHIQSYVLIGFNDTPEDALYRLQTIKDMGGLPNPMRYQPLDTPKRNSYIHPNWTSKELKDFTRYWSRQVYLGHITFREYQNKNLSRSKLPSSQKGKMDFMG